MPKNTKSKKSTKEEVEAPKVDKPASEEKKAKRHKKKKNSPERLGRPIKMIIRHVHPNTGISGAAATSLNALVVDFVSKVSEHANQLAIDNKKKTITSQMIYGAIKMLLPSSSSKVRDTLREDIIKYMRVASDNYNASVAAQKS
jgi:histone H2B